MNSSRTSGYIVAGLLLVGMAPELPFAAAQGASSPPVGLPTSTPLSELEIRLDRGGGGGSYGRCVRYRITILGNGLVRYEDLADPPVIPQQRTVPVDDVVSVANEFLRARFFEASDRYVGETFLVQEGDRLLLRGRGGADGPEWDLSFRLGPLAKTIHLYEGYPAGLGALRDLVERMGGPQAWTVKSSVVGTVVDATGQHLPGVAVTAIPNTGGDARAAMSGPNGSYTFDDLPEGTYRIDWDLPGFDVIRRNHVQVLRGETAQVDVTLRVSTICECISNWARRGVSRPRLTVHRGRVVDESGRPLPHARVEIVSPVGREAAYADREGRFQVRLSPNHTWPLTARDSGFGAVTQKVSGGTRAPTLVFRLPNVDTRALPVVERLTRPCCPVDLFTDLGP